MRTREEIEAALAGGLTEQQRYWLDIEIALDIRALLSERHTRREKEKVCDECHGKKTVVEYVGADNALIPTRVPCPSCQCLCKHIKVGTCGDYMCNCQIHA